MEAAGFSLAPNTLWGFNVFTICPKIAAQVLSGSGHWARVSVVVPKGVQ